MSTYQLFGVDKLGRLEIEWPAFSDLERDHLTGIPNRKALEMVFSIAEISANKQGAAFSIIIFDLDRFKLVNDTYGHLIGDEVLKEFTTRVKSVLRNTDFFARFGGEEFVIVTTAGYDEVLNIGERVRCTVCAAPFLSNSVSIEITCSFGCSVYPLNGLAVKEVLQKADEALYKAKNNGRNQGRRAT